MEFDSPLCYKYIKHQIMETTSCYAGSKGLEYALEVFENKVKQQNYECTATDSKVWLQSRLYGVKWFWRS